jgi:hypothetical protein
MTLDAKKIFKIASLSLLLLFIIGYALWGTQGLLFGVKIKDVNIIDGAKATDKVLKVTGNAKNAINLTLNDRPISIDQKGNFDETIILFSGYNIINIKAQDEFGNMDEKNYKLMY